MKKQFFCYFNELRKNIRNFCGLLRKNIHEFLIFLYGFLKTYAI